MTPAQINMNNPRWQRAIQVLNRMDPYRRQIFDTIKADEQFANEEMRSYLQGLDLASRQQAQDRRYGLARNQQRLNEREASSAEALGYLSLPVQALSGYGEYKNKQAEIKRNKYLASLFKGA